MAIRIIKTDRPLTAPEVIAFRDTWHSQKITHGGIPRGVKLRELVQKTIDDVKKRGDARVIQDTRKLHGVVLRPRQLRLRQAEIERAHREYTKEHGAFLRLIRRTISNVRRYQKSILAKTPRPLRRGGRKLSVRYTPIERVGVYVPGGRAAYPSSVIMTVVPAQVAGVREIAMLSPPQADGTIRPMVLAVAWELGLKEIYRASGVAGLAAMAFGTRSIRRVDKIVGPGSAYMAEAKRQLFGRVGIDGITGPSEVLIIADGTARADWLAADMLAQAEHDPGKALLVTTSDKLAGAVAAEIERQLPKLKRAKAAGWAIDEHSGISAIVVVPSIDKACDVANDFAPEHLQIVTANDEAVLGKVRNAGAIFVGAFTPVPLGDYYAGPSHVLPTDGTAKFSGALSCNDFLKATSVIRYDDKSFAQDAADVIDFASREGLTAHAESVRIRLERKK